LERLNFSFAMISPRDISQGRGLTLPVDPESA
jgi:hypothetical protein